MTSCSSKNQPEEFEFYHLEQSDGYGFIYNGDAVHVDVPTEHKGKPVVAVMLFAFSGEFLESVFIPDSITEIIGSRSHTLPTPYITVCENNANFTAIDGILFSKDMTALLAYPENKRGDYIIPDSVEEIYAFFNHQYLTGVYIPAGIKPVFGYYEETGEELIIYRNLFMNCTALINIEVSEDNPYYTAIDGVLFSKDGKILVSYPAGRQDAEYIIPDGTEAIERSAFSRVAALETVRVPRSMTRVESNFFDCPLLTRIYVDMNEEDAMNDIQQVHNLWNRSNQPQMIYNDTDLDLNPESQTELPDIMTDSPFY